MDMKQIIALVVAAQNGDNDALTSLFEKTYNELYYYAYRTVKNDDLANDVVQDTMIEIMNKLNTLQSPESFLLWAKQIIRRIAQRYLKVQDQCVPIEEEEGVQEIVDEAFYSNPTAVIDQADISGTILSFLNALPPEEKKAARQYYYDEMTVPEIAKVEGVSEKTIKSRLNSARRSLRQSIREYEEKYHIDLYGNSREKIYDIYISYSHRDMELAQNLAMALESENLSVYMTSSDTGSDAFANTIETSISRCRIILPIITAHSLSSAYCFTELQQAIDLAKSRSKELITVCYVPEALAQTPELELVTNFPVLTPADTSLESIAALGRQISGIIRGKKLETVLIETLSEFISAGLNDRATNVLCQLIQKICDQIRTSNQASRSESYITLISYLEKMSELYTFDYGEASSDLAHKKLDALSCVSSLLQTNDMQSDDLYYISIAIRLIYLDREIRLDCADAITHGDVSCGIVHTLPEQEYAERQQAYVTIYQHLLDTVNDLPDAQRQFILDTEKYIYKKPERSTAARPVITPSTPEDELLQAIASFTREGNKLFDLIGEQQPAKEFLQCLLTSYERLKSYSELVGAKQICAECIERIAELKNKLIETGEQIKATEKSEAGIKTLLGLTVPRSGKYDAFISHKKEDLDIAQDVYDFLRKNLKEPFLDRISLPEMSDAQYSKAIDLALEGSRHFIVVLSNLEYLESDWVEYEMDCFHTEKKEGRKEGGNFLFIVTDEVYDQIMSSNKMDLPFPYRRYEIFRLAQYKESLLSYLPT